jgi:hypothetical protein
MEKCLVRDSMQTVRSLSDLQARLDALPRDWAERVPLLVPAEILALPLSHRARSIVTKALEPARNWISQSPIGDPAVCADCDPFAYTLVVQAIEGVSQLDPETRDLALSIAQEKVLAARDCWLQALEAAFDEPVDSARFSPWGWFGGW